MPNPSPFDLHNKVALVTGAARGLGQGIAVGLAQQGADLILVGRPGSTSLDETADLIRPYGHAAISLTAEMRDLSQVRALAEQALKQAGRVDILVNNAGVNRAVPGLEVTEEKWDEQFDSNVKGGFFLAQALAPQMMARGWGRVIWISSQAGSVGIPGQPVYCATKGAVNQLVRTLGIEWAPQGLTVNAVCPTFVETDLTRERLNRPDFRQFVLGKLPGGHVAQVEDVAGAVVYLASEAAGMVNCHMLMVDGGWTAW